MSHKQDFPGLPGARKPSDRSLADGITAKIIAGAACAAPAW